MRAPQRSRARASGRHKFSMDPLADPMSDLGDFDEFLREFFGDDLADLSFSLEIPGNRLDWRKDRMLVVMVEVVEHVVRRAAR